MSQYFSRLAERSGVTTTKLATQSNSARTNGLSDPNKQTTEFTESVNSPAHDNPAVDERRPDHSTLDISATRQSGTVSTTAQGILHRVSAVFPGRKESPDIASELNVDMDSNPYSSDGVSRPISQTESISDASKKDYKEDRATDVKAKAQTTIDKTSHALIDTQSDDSTINDSAVSYSASVSEYVDDYLIEAPDAKTNTDSTEKLDRSRAMPSPQQSDKNERIERISSSPERAPLVAVTPTHSLSKSSVHVNIGKIELEIHAAAAVANQTPPPIRTIVASSPAVSRNSAFNPHRHYLRNR